MLEVACFNASSAIAAAKAGADRIELCADYAAGGITPPHSWVLEIRKQTKIPVNIMIRPRGGDFVYSKKEFEQMKHEVRLFKPDASGFVFGILDQQNKVDMGRNRELVELAAPLPCTFHRASDQTPDLSMAVKQIIECQFAAILTSGGMSDAASGAHIVAELRRDFDVTIELILGGGVRSSNIASLYHQTKLQWYHSAAITRPGELVDEEEVSLLRGILKQDSL